MPDPVRSSKSEAPTPFASDEPETHSSPRFVLLPGNHRVGIYLNEKNEMVPWQDGSGASEMLESEIEKALAVTYGTLVATFVLGPAARGIKGVAQAAWRVAQSAWASVTRAAATPQGTEVIRNTVECVGALVEGTPPPFTPVASECYFADKAIDKAHEMTDGVHEKAASGK